MKTHSSKRRSPAVDEIKLLVISQGADRGFFLSQSDFSSAVFAVGYKNLLPTLCPGIDVML